MQITVIIPSYNPDDKLLEVVASVRAGGFSDIVCVNDGSRPDCLRYFEQLAAFPEVTLLAHAQNRGKGAALKSAFRYLLERGGKEEAVVTVDGDNQHKLADILKVAEALREQEALILGVRCFDTAGVPARSSFGNKMTSKIFSVFCGLDICDTQTGLRGIPKSYLPELLALDGDRFEYETNMLLATKRLGLSVLQLPIETVYLEENKGSHFRPFADSFKILGLVAKFCASSLLCTAIDLLGYKFVYSLLSILTLSQRVLIATLAARIVSSGINYFLNKNAIFHAKGSSRESIVRYYLLAAVMVGCSYGGVFALSRLLGHSVWLKAVVDGLLFIASFRIQQRWVFPK